jgi:hypothetical protein
MKTIEFFSPADGDILINPDILFLKILFLYVGEEYWSSGSGDSYIDYNDGDKANRLEILYNRDFGFYLRYKSWGNDFHSLNVGDYSKITKVYIGGNTQVLPVKFFLSREIAFEVVKFFCETGERSSKINWGDHDKIEWDWDKYLE